MEWYYALAFILGAVLVLMFLGMPVAFAFMVVNFAGVFMFWGGIPGFERLIGSMARSVSIFSLIPIPLFILLGLIMFYSGMTSSMVEAIDKWLGRLPGRLGLLSVAGGTLLGALCGDSMASVAVLGTMMYPEMKKKGYDNSINLGSIVCTGRLALMIPPSTLAVIFGSLALISIGKILMAIAIPGLILAVVFALYIILRCKLNPSLAPSYDIPSLSFAEKLKPLLRDVVPLLVIIFLVTGVIFLGVATPAEAAATGAFGALLLAAAYGKLNKTMIRKTMIDTLEISIMIFMVIASAVAFSTNLAITGASRGLVEFVAGLSLSPMIIVISSVIIILLLGMVMECVAMMMITVPLLMPIIDKLGVDPVWWAVAMLLAISIGPITPPFGLDMFVLNGIVSEVKLEDIFKASLPFAGITTAVLIIVIAFPQLSLWLPSIMR